MRIPGEIAREEYDAHPAVRWSHLSHMRKSPLHYRHTLETESKRTPALRTGSAVHALTFEPHTYAERFAVYRESKNKGEGSRTRWQQFQEDAANRGITILDADEAARAEECAQAVARHEQARMYINPSRGRAEIPVGASTRSAAGQNREC